MGRVVSPTPTPLSSGRVVPALVASYDMHGRAVGLFYTQPTGHEGVNVDGENLSNLRFADDVALLNETTKQMEKHLNNLNSESLKVGLKYTKERQST